MGLPVKMRVNQVRVMSGSRDMDFCRFCSNFSHNLPKRAQNDPIHQYLFWEQLFWDLNYLGSIFFHDFIITSKFLSNFSFFWCYFRVLLKPPITDQPTTDPVTHRPLTSFPSIHGPLTHWPTINCNQNSLNKRPDSKHVLHSLILENS